MTQSIREYDILSECKCGEQIRSYSTSEPGEYVIVTCRKCGPGSAKVVSVSVLEKLADDESPIKGQFS